jgi:hypothetical protein
MIKQSVLGTEISTIRCLAGNDLTFATVTSPCRERSGDSEVERVDRGGGRSEDALNA